MVYGRGCFRGDDCKGARNTVGGGGSGGGSEGDAKGCGEGIATTHTPYLALMPAGTRPGEGEG